jgi:hypothetical protein
MKTTIKKMILAVMVITLVSANAIAFEDSLKVNDEKSFDLVLTEVTKQTQISLLDKRNNVLFTKTIEGGENFSKTFNLELLAEGDYFVEIEDEIKLKRLALEVNENDVTSCSSSQHEYFKPVVNEKGSTVYVSHFSPSMDPLYVAIYNNKNEMIHEEILKGKMDLGKKFDFSRTYSGEYRFYLESNGISYDHLVYVEK